MAQNAAAMQKFLAAVLTVDFVMNIDMFVQVLETCLPAASCMAC